MIARIRKLLDSEQMNPSQFADEIKLQRSSLSHVLSGRNKPSLDFVMKIKQRFPKVNLEWLLFGDEPMFLDMQNQFDSEKNPREIENTREFASFDAKYQKSLIDDPKDSYTESNLAKDLSHLQSSGKAKKVVIFFNDGTFEEYSRKDS